MKAGRIELDIDSEKAVAIIRKKCDELVKDQENYIKEKIAFAAFINHYYKHRLQLEGDKYLREMMLKELKEIWVLGKKENKLEFFFSLADEVFNIDLIEERGR